MLEKVFHHLKQVCQTGRAPCSALRCVDLRRSFPIAVAHLGTLHVSSDLLCATITQQTNHLRAGSSLPARCCIQSKISQGIKSKAQIISTAQPRLSCPRPEIQITTSSSSSSWRSGKPDTKSFLLKTRRLHCSSHEGLSVGAAPAGPAAASGILSSAAASGWADQALLALHTGAAETALPGPA